MCFLKSSVALYIYYPFLLSIYQVLEDKESKLKEEYADENKVIPKPGYWWVYS